MKYHLSHLNAPSDLSDGDLVGHQYHGDGVTRDLWQLIWIVVGVIVLCALIGFCLACFRRGAGGGMGGSMAPRVRGVYL
jgi:hypothetical protein